ncbi:hypothetical protein ACGFJT_38250 [Actinomadura geliboluensis]|uniref:hypothetical protein n=1 Tax=Actinomadura geliboluensis TaxID=882440 RepID=UPI003715399F
MRDARHPALPPARRPFAGTPAARLLVVVLGLLGFVVGPVGAGTHGGTSATGTVSGLRPAPVAKAPTRGRTSTKPRTVRHAQVGPRAQAVVAAAAQHAAGAAAPGAQPVHAALPAAGADVPPPAGRPYRPAAAPVSPDLAPPAAPRGRAPPSTARI